MKPKQVEILVCDGCPSVELTVERARDAIRKASTAADLRVMRIENAEQARSSRFLGSPTIRVDGVDIDASADGRDDFGLQCRVYSVGGRLESSPPTAWILAALRS